MADRDPMPQEAWAEACWKAEEYVKAASFEDAGDMAIEVAHELLSIAHQLKGVACCVCNGRGTLTYGDTSTWRRAIGGQQLTEGVCERCWGTGRADKSGPDLRRIKGIEQQNERICLVVEQFCRQCEYRDEPGSCPDCTLQPYGGGK